MRQKYATDSLKRRTLFQRQRARLLHAHCLFATSYPVITSTSGGSTSEFPLILHCKHAGWGSLPNHTRIPSAVLWCVRGHLRPNPLHHCTNNLSSIGNASSFQNLHVEVHLFRAADCSSRKLEPLLQIGVNVHWSTTVFHIYVNACSTLRRVWRAFWTKSGTRRHECTWKRKHEECP